VCPQDLAAFLDLAEELQVKGLTRRTSEQQDRAATAKDELLQTPAKSSFHNSVISKTDLEAKEGLLLASNNIGLVVEGVRSLNPEAFGPELEKEAARDSSAASLYDEVTPVRTSKDSTADATKDSRSGSRPPEAEVKISMIVTHHSKRKTLPSSRATNTTGNEGDSSSSTRKRSRQDSSAATGSSSSSSSKSTSEPAASTSEPDAARQKSTTQSQILPVGSQGVLMNPDVKSDSAGVVDLPREAAAKKEIDITDHMEAVRRSLLVTTSPGSIPSTTGQRGPDMEGGGNCKESTALLLLAELDQQLEKLSQDFVVAKAGGSWQCLSCEQLFAEKADCQHHIERRHVAVPSGHLCKLCGRRFGSVRAAKEHVEETHGRKEDKKSSKDLGSVEIITI
jgi:hypothetical protein